MKKIVSGTFTAILLLSCSQEKTGDRLLAEPDKHEQLISEHSVRIHKIKIRLKKDFHRQRIMNGLMKRLIHSGFLLKILS